jgi:hypothetical protein
MERSVAVVELACFPAGCLIPEPLQASLAFVLIPGLRAAGLTPADWTRGAQGEEPHAATVRRIVCSPCRLTACPLNPRHLPPPDEFSGMRAQLRVDREAAAAEIIANVTPDDLPSGVTIRASAYPSIRNPGIAFTIKRGDAYRLVYCDVATMKIRIGGNEQPLTSLQQLRQVLGATALELPA